MICRRERRCCYGAGAPLKVIPASRSRISLRHGVMDAPSSPLYTDTGESVKVTLKYRSNVICSIKHTQTTLKKHTTRLEFLVPGQVVPSTGSPQLLIFLHRVGTIRDLVN